MTVPKGTARPYRSIEVPLLVPRCSVKLGSAKTCHLALVCTRLSAIALSSGPSSKWWIGLCRADMMPRSVGMFTLVWFFRRLMLLHSVSRAGYGTVLVTCTRREAPNETGAALSFPSSMQHLEGEPEDQWRRCDIGATSHRRGHTRGVQLSVWPDKS